MSRKSRIVLVSIFGLLFALGLGAWGVFQAAHAVPAFYREALDRDTALAEISSDEFLQRAAGIASDVTKPGNWEASFTADQINGWLSVDMARNHPQLLPPTMADPRVQIRQGEITLAARYDGPEFNGVLTISCDVYLSPPNSIAIRLKGAHAGLMPLPLGKVLEAISHFAREAEVPLQWRRSGNDPVALMAVSAAHASSDHRQVALDSIALGDGEIHVVGRTDRAPVVTAARVVPSTRPAAPPALEASKSLDSAPNDDEPEHGGDTLAPDRQLDDAKPMADEASPDSPNEQDQPEVAAPIIEKTQR